MNTQSQPSSPGEPSGDYPDDDGFHYEARRFSVSSGLDVLKLVATIRRHARLAVAVGLIVFLAVAATTFSATPRYTATANVMLDARKERVVDTVAVLSGLPADTATVDSEVEILRSRSLAERVVSTMNLEDDPEFNSAIAKPKGIKLLVGGLVKMVTGSVKPEDLDLSPVERQRAHERVVGNVLSRLSIRRVGLTYVIDISFESERPEKAAKIANSFAKLYLTEQLEAKFQASQQANQWISERLKALAVEVQQDDAAVQQYKIANNLLSASGATLAEQEISTYNQNLATARMDAAEDQARLSAARAQLARGSNGSDVGEALNSEVIRQLRGQRAAVSGRVADLQGRYGDRHPEMLKAQRELIDIDSQIQQEIQRIISNLEAKVAVSRQRLAAAQGSISGARGTLANTNRAAVQLNELQRKADASRGLYEGYLSRFKETTTQQGTEKSDARIVSEATIPIGQSSPKVALNLALGLILAFGAGAGSILAAELLNVGLATAGDVETQLDIPYLGAVPLLDTFADSNDMSAPDYLVAKPLSAFSEAFRHLRASIIHSRLGHPVKVIAVTSALPGEGKTTTTICLARSAALQGFKVLMIDCDLRRRTMNRMLLTEPKTGLLDVLAGDKTLAETVLVDEATGAHFLLLPKRDFTPRDVFGSEAMDRLLREVRWVYDLVILDTAPVLPVADTRILAPKTDAVVFLARWRKTPRPAIEAALHHLSSPGVHIAGVVLSQMDTTQQAKYGYGDAGYYYNQYKSYYTS